MKKSIIGKTKDLLDKDAKISVGDIVTIDDDSNDIETYVIKSIDGPLASICGLEITVARDDVYIKEMIVPLKSLIYIGESFINVNGCLWRVRNNILKGQRFDLYAN